MTSAPVGGVVEPGLSPGLPCSGLMTKGEPMAELVTLERCSPAIMASLSSSSRCRPVTIDSSSRRERSSASCRALVSSSCFLSICILSPPATGAVLGPGVLGASVAGLAELEPFLLDLMTANLCNDGSISATFAMYSVLFRSEA